MRTALTAPRPLPGRLAPVLAGGLVLAFALPVFALAGWRIAAWALAAVLWVAGQTLSALLARLRPGGGNLAASGVLAFGMMFRSISIVIVLFAVATSDARLALSAALLYALAYTLELGMSLASYFGAAP